MFQKISSVVEMTADHPDEVKITWEATCLDENKRPLEPTESNMCDKVGIGDEVQFRATIEVRDGSNV